MDSLSQTYWARCLKYEPFVMGGDVWQPRRYAVEGVEFLLPVEGVVYSLFWVMRGDNLLMIHEKNSGGFICEQVIPISETDSVAVRIGLQLEAFKRACVEAQRLIGITPDFAKQIKKLGDIMSHPEISTEDALRMLQKERDKEKRKKDRDAGN